MGWIQSFTCITACVLLLQQSTVSAMPMNEPRALIKRGATLTGKFLHITDIHIDPKYLEGADPDNYCHRHGKKRSSESGKYGALGTRCDSPVALVKTAFDFLKKEIRDIDFIIYTGDTVRHDRDDDLPRTKKDVIDGHTSVMKYFQSAYDLKHTPYIPTIGNNDAFGHNDVVKNDKIFTSLKTIWSPLSLNLTQAFSSGGYFVQDIVPDKLSVINLNSMYFFEKNSDVADCSSSTSPATVQMKWLESTLKEFKSKGNGHQVYMMSHVPPIDDDGSKLYKDSCYSQYLNLLGNYGSIIAGHFNGHTNNDNLNAVIPDGKKDFTYIAADDKDARDLKSTLAKSAVALFNAPSIIPVHNPALRVYTYDIEGKDYPYGTIRNWEQYYIDLDDANNGGPVEFKLEYDATHLYGVDHFDGAGVGQAITNIVSNDKSRDLYKKYAQVSS
ncbi:hypothetical protein INT47_012726 [Mucor saturninus]|uniref:Calcineurin-like phosphoesterase domain-containing protein n=1 Tax=Mucor saturninus TaxID=64648 RepID=A0A8H7R3Y5_9FUNG|nr:hypothetical protein INT47_012726 [Mucor saturninus]